MSIILLVLLIVSIIYNFYQNLLVQALREQLDNAEERIKFLNKTK